MRILSFFALLLLTKAAAAASLVVYDGQLENGFSNYYSWATTYSFSNSSPVYLAEPHSVSFKPDNWGGVRVLSGNNGATQYSFANYSSLTFWVNGGSSSGQKVTVDLQLIDTGTGETVDYGGFDIGTYTSGGSIAAGTWKQVTINFDTARLTYGNFNALVFQANSSTSATQPMVYFGDVGLNARSGSIGSGGAVNVNINAGTTGNPVHPLIFGVAYGDATRNGQIGYTVRRWGGNSTTRYNWKVDVHNTANDYYYENIPDCTGVTCTGTPPVGNSADTFISSAIRSGSQPLITIPTIGWTPRADSALQHPYTVGFSVAKYGAQQSVDPYDPKAGNGYHTNGTAITGNDPTDSSTAVDPTFEQAWIAHLQSAFGNAANGGVQFYSLDNEVMLWNSTHRDVHPTPPTYDEIWGKASLYATAIKNQDPNALVTGPVTWGYPDLFTSAADAASCNCSDGTDRQTHGDLPFVAWYLQQVCSNPLTGGAHLVDFLDLHYYPQGNGVSLSNADDPATAALRLRSLRELYDPAWVSESWIGSLGDFDENHYNKPDLIPRVKAWITQYCPSTKLAITEYNWGNDNTTSGAVAQAEALAIFAREGVDMATRWIAPVSGTTGEKAFSIFLNYDGAGAKVQGNSIAASSVNVDQIGAYAFHLAGQRTMVLLTNKDTLTHDAVLTFDATHSATWKLYGFTGSSALGQTGTGSINGTTLTLFALPPISATLLVIPDNDEIFKNGFE